MTPPVRDPYTVLGVSRQASSEDIKNAFRRLARDYHPDRNPNDAKAEERFREINAAYQILSDPQKRNRFDSWGQNGGPAPGGPNVGRGGAGLDDLLSEILGTFNRRTHNRGDVRHVVQLTFREAALGCIKAVTYERVDLCAQCDGHGAALNAGFNACGQCRGRGKVAVAFGGLFGGRAEQMCPTCGGRGKLPQVPCGGCNGTGLAAEQRTIEVKIPAGIEAEATQPVPGGGDRVSAGGAPGTLELVIDVLPDPLFEREGDDVIASVGVTFPQAVLGAEVKVETLHGLSTVRIPPGSEMGHEIRLKGLGVPHRFRSGAGSHIVKLRLTIPEQLSARAQQLVAAYDAALKENESGFLDKIKGLW
jgi:molecular chaperone DnaJ